MSSHPPSLSETALLSTISRYGLLTAAQVQHLAAFATLRYSQARLKTLTDSGYLERPRKSGMAVGGSEPLVYWLSRRGRDILRQQGIDPGNQIHEPAPITRRHSLAVNDVLIAAEVFCRQDDRFQLADARSDRQLRQVIKGPAVPDGFLDFRLRAADGAYQVPFLLEVDRGTMQRSRFQAKIQAIETWIGHGGYQETFGIDALEAIAVVGQHRFLEEWIVAIARTSSLFRVTTTAPLPAARSFFLDRVWRIPGIPDLVPLIEV